MSFTTKTKEFDPMTQAHSDDRWDEFDETEARWAHLAMERMLINYSNSDEDFGFRCAGFSSEPQTGMLAR
jgi:hypothetical protein